jgi:two-component system cell cycle sensor histidine kinase/response regulator CckA
MLPQPRAPVVLLVEDDAAVRATVSRFLREAGYAVVEASDGQQAWTRFRRRPDRFDALVTDVVMPKLPGTELAARVRELRPELPVVLMTGYTQAGLLERGLQATHGQLLTKPFDGPELIAALRAASGET